MGDVHSVSTLELTEVFHSPSEMTTKTGGGAPDPLAPSIGIEVEPKVEGATGNGVYWVFVLVFLLEVFVNFDSGVIPAILPTLEKEFDLVGTTEGLLGALPYIGLAFSSPFAGRGLTLFSPKYFCFFTMLVNVLATGLLGVAVHRWMLFFSRLLIGLTQAGFSIYAPVWVDRFAPRDKVTLWMGLAQGGVVIGTMLGCVTAGALDAARRSGVAGAHWRYALGIQFTSLLILVVVWGFTPRSLLEIQMVSSAVDETDSMASSRSLDQAEAANSGEEVSSEEEAAGRTESKASRPPPIPEEGVMAVKGSQVRSSTSTGTRVSLKPLSVVIGRLAGLEEPREADRREGRAGRRGDPTASQRERRLNRPPHRQSDLPEYLKDPLSNLLPLDFFATNAQPRRLSQIRHHSAACPGRRIEGHRSVMTADGAITSLHVSRGGESGLSSSLGVGPGQSFQRGRAQSLCDTRDPRGFPMQSLDQFHLESRQDTRGEGVNNTFQYQMTFLTPHPTTLAFEALNWASGTQDPMLLVQRDSRHSTLAQRSSTVLERSPSVERGAGDPLSAPSDGHSGLRGLASRGYERSIDTHVEGSKDGLCESTQIQTSNLETASPIRAELPTTHGVRESIKILLSSPLYVCVTFSLCALFFEVTAIQFWSISYFHQVVQQSTSTVLVAFNVTAATAPISGVLGGGWFIDFLGGYKDQKGMRRTMFVLLFWATFCFLLGVGAGWTKHFWHIVFCTWWILFFGGCILPAATGIVITSVPVEVRAFGSGFCMMVYNILGYVLGTSLPGILIEAVSLTWGMRAIYLWALNGVLGFVFACCFLWRLEIKPTFISDQDEVQWSSEPPIGDGNQRRDQQDANTVGQPVDV